MLTELEHPDPDSIAVTDFKGRCLAVIDAVAQGRTGPVILTRRNRPVAAIVPIDDTPPDLYGAMLGSVTVAPGTDLTQGTGDLWDADR